MLFNPDDGTSKVRLTKEAGASISGSKNLFTMAVSSTTLAFFAIVYAGFTTPILSLSEIRLLIFFFMYCCFSFFTVVIALPEIINMKFKTK